LRILCVLGEHNYGDPSRGAGYEYSNFLPALRKLGHEVAHFESFSRTPYSDFEELNRRLLERVESFAPDVLFCVLMQYEVWLETLRIIRESGVRLVNWSTDDSWKYPMFSRLIAREFDLFATTYPDAAAWYARDHIDSVHLSQWAANPDALAAPLSARDCQFAVSFVGSAYGDRPALVEALRRSGIDVACFGQGWPAGPVDAYRIPEIVRASKVSLNFSAGSRAGDASPRQVKARVFEVPGYGGCLLTERAPHLDRYFRCGTEIEVFDGTEDLIAKARSLASDTDRRDAVACAGFQRVREEHTYDGRFAALLAALDARSPGRARRAIDWRRFDDAAARHTCGPALRAMRSLLTVPAKLVWGEERGPRAARRALFELSWRAAGPVTYAAGGLPGRLFYRES
jgi:spore maturation protein CgeB